MENILQKEIANCLKALQQPNRTVDNYRCYYEGRKALAEELLLKLPQADVSGSLELLKQELNRIAAAKPSNYIPGVSQSWEHKMKNCISAINLIKELSANAL